VIARYRSLLSIPGFSRLLLSAVLGRLPSGMFSLAIVLLVHAQTGSFFDAGLAVGAFALAGAVMGPPLGALVDRIGQAPVLIPTAAIQAALLVILVLMARGEMPIAEIVATAALAGASQPPIAGCIRTLWSAIAKDEETLEIAYTLDATTQEVIWTLGPLLVGTTAGLLSPSAGVLLCAAITLCGTLLFAGSELSSGWQASTQTRTRGGALASSGLRALLVTVALAGVVLGTVDVGLPALAVRVGARWSSGPLLALFSVGSMVGGLAYSARSWNMTLARRYMAMLLAMAVAVAPLIAARSVAAGFALSALAGLAVAPMLSAQFSLVGALAAADTTTEAFAWHRAATIGGMAGGSALGGSLVDAHGAAAAFALGCASVGLALALAVAWRGRIEPKAAGARETGLAAAAGEPAAL
jgi:predicted MFS family arabinose efflux permease